MTKSKKCIIIQLAYFFLRKMLVVLLWMSSSVLFRPFNRSVTTSSGFPGCS